MRIHISEVWVGLFVALLLGYGVEVAGGHEHYHEHGGGRGEQIPLHEREYVQDSPEELERKWSFEVS